MKESSVRTLGYFNDDVSLDILIKQIASKEEAVGVAAARSLGLRCSTRRVDPLLYALKKASLAVKKAAYESLNRLWIQAFQL